MIAARAAGGLAALAAVALAIACSNEPSSHLFAGRALDDGRGCLRPTTSVDVVDGPAPASTCDPKCVVSPPDFDSGVTTVFVSTMCPPYPAAPFDTSGRDPRCPTAIAAYGANVTCLDDGGVANAIPDAGPAADASLAD